VQTVGNICAVCACQKLNSDLKLVTYKHTHQPDHFIYRSCKHDVWIHQSEWINSNWNKSCACKHV